MILFFNTKKLPAQNLETYEANLIKNKGLTLSSNLLKYWNLHHTPNQIFKAGESSIFTNNILQYTNIKKNKTNKILILLQLLKTQLKRTTFLKILFTKISKFLKIWFEEKIINELLILKKINKNTENHIINPILQQLIQKNIELKIKKLKIWYTKKFNTIIKKLKITYSNKIKSIKNTYKETLKYYTVQYQIPYLRKFFMQLIKYPYLLEDPKYLQNFLKRRLSFQKTKKLFKLIRPENSLKNKYPLLKSIVSKNATYTKNTTILNKNYNYWKFILKNQYNLSETKLQHLINTHTELLKGNCWTKIFIILENETSNIFNVLNNTYQLDIPEENILVNEYYEENPKYIQVSDMICMVSAFIVLSI